MDCLVACDNRAKLKKTNFFHFKVKAFGSQSIVSEEALNSERSQALLVPSPVLELRRASKAAPSGDASSADERPLLLDDISLSVYPGERIGVFASQEAESTALINCLAGIAPLDSGELVCHGSVSWPMGANEALDLKLSGYANARFAVEIYEQPANLHETIALVRDLSGLTEDEFHSPFSSYTGRQKNTFRLALSLALNFDCYLIGQVGDGWKVGRRRTPDPIFAPMKERLEGKTLVITSSTQVIFALRYCTSGIAIVEGKIVYRGDPQICLQMILDHRRLQNEEALEEDAPCDDAARDTEGLAGDYIDG